MVYYTIQATHPVALPTRILLVVAHWTVSASSSTLYAGLSLTIISQKRKTLTSDHQEKHSYNTRQKFIKNSYSLLWNSQTHPREQCVHVMIHSHESSQLVFVRNREIGLLFSQIKWPVIMRKRSLSSRDNEMINSRSPDKCTKKVIANAAVVGFSCCGFGPRAHY